MSRLGLIRNPRSQRNKRGGGDAREQAAALLGFYFAEPATRAELAETLSDFAREGVDVLCVDGGDGTVRDVLTAMPGAFGDKPPRMAILAAGKTNLIAADVGTPGHGLKGLRRLIDAAQSGRLDQGSQRRPVLTISWPDGEHGTVRGMFMGAGAFTRGTELANARIHNAGFTQGAAVALAMAGVLGGALIGRDAHGWLAGESISLSADGERAPSGNRFLFLSTTLHRLILGLWPFWNHGDARLRYLDVAAAPPSLMRALPRLAKGNPSPWMLESGAYRSGGADRIDMVLPGPFIMDGETYPGGRIQLSSADHIDFIIP
ncbi:diacylglycerol/lipid kinase family protein [Niveispirillum irakense]|uniref:diacylglycerol/lipid kinase family protein n=1 Tax=Niveispirillum irakense TaxID=34011 RepID=UPI00041534D2|nr:diacylglycerol kinase family protein [Niveispirillum irakense]